MSTFNRNFIKIVQLSIISTEKVSFDFTQSSLWSFIINNIRIFHFNSSSIPKLPPIHNWMWMCSSRKLKLFDINFIDHHKLSSSASVFSPRNSNSASIMQIWKFPPLTKSSNRSRKRSKTQFSKHFFTSQWKLIALD